MATSDVILRSKRVLVTKTIVQIDEQTYSVNAINGVSVRHPQRGAWYVMSALCLVAAALAYAVGEVLWALAIAAIAPIITVAAFGANSSLILEFNGRKISVLKSRDPKLLAPYKTAIAKALGGN